MWFGIDQILYIQTILVLYNSIPELECPRRNGSSPVLLLYPETNECYEEGSRGPCGENMKLYSVDKTKTNGECDCDQLPKRMLLYNKKLNKCFPIFQRGPCTPGKWTDVTSEGTPICRPNLCYNSTESLHEGANEKDIVLINGTCVEVGATSVCPRGSVVGFEVGKRLPTCVRLRFRAIGVPRTRCSPGTYRAVSGRCQPAFEFD